MKTTAQRVIGLQPVLASRKEGQVENLPSIMECGDSSPLSIRELRASNDGTKAAKEEQ